MSAPAPIDVIVNPGNVSQRYILWSNGRVDAVGGAPAITSGPAWYDQTQMPWGVAIWITNWSNGQGYVLDAWGYHAPLNGAATISTSVGGSLTDYTNSNGLPYTWPTRTYTDWTWDPLGSGHGYALTLYGKLVQFGGAVAPPRTGDAFPWDAARKIQALWSTGAVTKAVWLDYHGRCHAEFSAVLPATGPFWPGSDAARDLQITDWTTPISGYVLDLYGGVDPFGSAVSTFGGPYSTGADNARCLSVLNVSNPLKLWQVWAAGQQFEYNVSSAPTVNAGGGVSEVQTVTITGTPTGGGFTLTFGANTTISNAFNAPASTVQTNLRNLASIGGTNVNVTGGPGPGTPYVVTFASTLATTNVAQMTAAHTFTGGSSPNIAVTTTTDGVTASPANTVTTTTQPVLAWAYSDPQKDSQAAYEVVLYTTAYVGTHSILNTNPTDPVAILGALAYATDTNPSVRGVVPSIDLTNTGYTYYVRAMDSSGLWSAWSTRAWTQNVAVPATPTGLALTPDQTNLRVGLSVSSSLGATYIQFQCSDDGGTTWTVVRGADAVPLLATTTATDYDPPLGVARMYRAFSYSTAPRTASLFSGTASTTITRKTFCLTATSDPSLGGEVNVIEKPSWTRPVKAGVFEGLGATYPTVVSDGPPKARKTSLTIDCNSRTEWNLVNNVVMANSTLVLRDPFGDVVYCRVVGDWSREQQRRAPALTETTSLRHAHHTVLPLVEVSTPTVTSAYFTVAPGP